MPKTEIDYSNTIIYKITCKNKEITDVYVGHTTNFVQRKHAHKQSCLNEKTANYKCKLYEVIRANGGWSNWKMEIINFFNCADHYAARKKEQEYFISLNATLNSIEPFPKPKVYIKNDTNIIVSNKLTFFCETCHIKCDSSKSFENHKNTNIHKKKIEMNEKKENNKITSHIISNNYLESSKMFTKHPIPPQPKFMCDVCNVSTVNKKDYNKHLLTRKHQNVSKYLQDGDKNTIKQYVCDCGKQYSYRQSLYVHRKTCIKIEESPQNNIKPIIKEQTENEIKILTSLVLELVKSNTDLQKQMMEVCKKGNNINTNNSYNNNKTFNMQFFLNEQCKDAMNLTDFVDSMTLEFSDLEDVGKLGYVEGISKIMIRKLNELDIYKRPIHCSDAKREIMYVKEHNVWGKEKNSNEHIRKAIKRVTHKNGGLLVPWSLENPNCMNLDHHLNDVYLRMMGQSMGGSGEFVDNENKIIKKIAKAVFIDK